MTNITDIMKKYGLEVPEDKLEGFNKEVAANYKTVTEFEKKVTRLETERDNFKKAADTANDAIKGFEGVDVEGMKKQIEDYKAAAKTAEDEYNKKLAARDFDDALRAAVADIKFTSAAAKKSVMDTIKAADLKLYDGKILGLSDMIDQLKESDAGAFVDEKQEELDANKAKVTTSVSGKSASGKPMTRDEIMAIKDRDERRAAIAANMKLFEK